jgi:hypothetical protein
MGSIRWLRRLKPLRVSMKLRGLYLLKSIGKIIMILAALLSQSSSTAWRMMKYLLYSLFLRLDLTITIIIMINALMVKLTILGIMFFFQNIR